MDGVQSYVLVPSTTRNAARRSSQRLQHVNNDVMISPFADTTWNLVPAVSPQVSVDHELHPGFSAPQWSWTSDGRARLRDRGELPFEHTDINEPAWTLLRDE